jgi:hypothetical protein
MPPPEKTLTTPEDFTEYTPSTLTHEDQIEKMQQYAHKELVRLRQEETSSLENSGHKSQTPESSPDNDCHYTHDGRDEPISCGDDDDDDDEEYYIEDCTE